MKALEGIKILDFSQVHGASFATMLLGDFGAEIIKVERPGKGDIIRTYAPLKQGKSGYHAYMNRNKKSIAIDISTPEGQEIIKEFAKNVDVLCENYRCGTMEKYGLGYDDLKRINPGLIYATLTGFGRIGPMRNHACVDNTAQAFSGIMDMTGSRGGPPVTMGAQIANQFGGMHLAYAIMLAMIHKLKTGEGQFIDISSVDSLFTVLEMGEISIAIGYEPFVRKGNHSQAIAPYDTFKTVDGYVSVGVSTNDQWAKFCKQMKLEYLVDDPRFTTNEKRGINYIKHLKPVIEELTHEMSKFELEKLLLEEKIPCGAVCTVEDIVEGKAVYEREMVLEVEDKSLGKIKMPGIPAKLYKTPGTVESAPLLGEHTVQYLEKIGYTAGEIENFKGKGIVEILKEEERS